ncbi:acetate/propionate family kinase [Spiractinospora alimapuensis]|uniref:acetate/propionate family kinase n=1 Tax=Spiractinospora alimapuensis TaxID=2820884 RepID=UPI001F0189E6|nr:acetate/propionate family kinase [Spiractinospora alimapuensis]QVQ51989.1 acetate/propionate family kinase [Spiractinospora alimapuensis]
MRILVVNTGSSSVKLRLLDSTDTVLASHDLPVIGGRVPHDEIVTEIRGMPAIDAVGHRVVHGGPDFSGPRVLDERVLRRLHEFVDLAPLHQPKALAGIDAASVALPDVPAVACFDTAFHADLPPESTTYAIPERWRREYGLRRYGFQGLSFAYATRRAEEILGRDPGRLVIAHLGSGASLAAVHGGRSLDTTMGFTPDEGLVMATRSGSVDPGMLMWLLRRPGIDLESLSAGLEQEGGLVALAGTADMAEIVRRFHAGQPHPRLALDVYLHRLRAGICAMAAALCGIDTLVFTGGVGENAPMVRSGAAAGLVFLGLAIDGTTNADTTGDADISSEESDVSTLVVSAREDIQIATEVRRVLDHR